jgi:hypothetical protein
VERVLLVNIDNITIEQTVLYLQYKMSIAEKVHSQGRVLGDRSVLYKYANPNLVAILSHNRPESSLRLHLVDAVSGELVYTGKYSKAHPPFHIVHCENWIVVSPLYLLLDNDYEVLMKVNYRLATGMKRQGGRRLALSSCSRERDSPIPLHSIRCIQPESR